VSNQDFEPENKPIRATVAKEAGQGMSTEETTVRPDQNDDLFAGGLSGSLTSTARVYCLCGCPQ